MEKEPKKSAVESTSRQAETSDREPEAGSSPCESPEPHPGILREIGKEAREQVRPNQGYLKIDYFTLFWLFVAGSVFGLVVETVFHAIVYGGYESRAGLGLLGLVWVRTILPFIKRVFSHVDARSMLARLVTAALSLFMALNIAVTLLALDREGQRAAGVPATTWEQRFFDEHFPDSYLQSRMQNMSVYGKG